MSESTSASSALRPTKELAGRGRFVFEIVLSGGKAPVTELEDRHRALDVLEAVLAEVGERVAVEEDARRLREHDLASVARSCNPRGEMDVVPDVALVRGERSARVEADAQLDRAVGERAGHRACRGDRSRRGLEGEEERVSLRVDLDPVLGSARLTDDATVLRKRLRVRVGAELAQELRRALDVGEEEGDRSGREVLSHAT